MKKSSDHATPLDENETQGLLLPHITTKTELDRWEQENINEAVLWVDKTKPKNILDISFAFKLHKKMFGKVWKWAGTIRKSGKNIGSPWLRVQPDLKILFGDTEYWIKNNTFNHDEIGARFHHKLVYIHPFANGNGRHARLMTDILMKYILKDQIFSWGSKGMNKRGESRSKYISALKLADNGDYSLLIKFVRS